MIGGAAKRTGRVPCQIESGYKKPKKLTRKGSVSGIFFPAVFFLDPLPRWNIALRGRACVRRHAIIVSTGVNKLRPEAECPGTLRVAASRKRALRAPLHISANQWYSTRRNFVDRENSLACLEIFRQFNHATDAHVFAMQRPDWPAKYAATSSSPNLLISERRKRFAVSAT